MKILQATICLFLILLSASCDSSREVTVIVTKNGTPLAGVQVEYAELNNRLDSHSYSGLTDSAGKVSFRVERDIDPITYYLSIPSENGGEDIARGGFSGGSRVAQWHETGYRVTFK